MIFTDEEIMRLPGATVELRNGKVCEVTDVEGRNDWWDEFACATTKEGLDIFANRTEHAEQRNHDIKRVIKWAKRGE